MGYLKIPNLYQAEDILAFRWVYALEKVHGTSAHIWWNGTELHFYSNGEKHEKFLACFDQETLAAVFREHFGPAHVVVYGEAYGGKQQGMGKTYGPSTSFIVFDVKVGNCWLDVPKAENVAMKLDLEFVPWQIVEGANKGELLTRLDAQRDAPSIVAERRGMGTDKLREGIVLRPPFEVRLNNDTRLIAKHKREEHRETKTPREIGKRPEVLAAEAAADEWATAERLRHVVGQLTVDGVKPGIEDTKAVLVAMVDDILNEGAGEVVDSREFRSATCAKTAKMFKAMLRTALG